MEATPNAPLLFTYQSDGTSSLCQSTAQASASDKRALRRGKVLEEFLMERSCVHIVRPSGKIESALLVGEPRSLSQGKKAWNLFAAAAGFFPLVRQLGHQGICVFHFGSGRAMFTALDRLLRQRRQAYYNPEVGPDLGAARDQLFMMDFFVSTGCASHDVSNALKWSFPAASGAETLKDLHIAVESLRNSYRFLHQRLPRFIRESVAFAGPAPEDDLFNFWRALGIDVDWLDLVASLNPHWCDGQLMVSAAAQDDPLLVEHLSAVILHIWRWRKFSDTRWCGVGVSCRTLVASLVIGVDQVVAAALADPNSSNYHLHGFQRLTPVVRQHAVILGMASWPAEALQLDLLEDDRVALRAVALKEAFSEEMEWLQSVGQLAWARLCAARAVDSSPSPLSPSDLRSATVSASHVAAAYTSRKLWRVVDGLLWSLAQGDIKANLMQLKSNGYSGTEPFTLQLHRLLLGGFSCDRLTEAVEFLRSCPWSTVTVEQAHGSMAVLHRFHPQLTRSVLSHRTVVHQCRAVFHHSQQELRAQKTEKKAAALENKVPSRVGGKGIFWKDMFHQIESKLPPGTKMSQSLRQEVVKNHGSLFRNLTTNEQREYERKAAAHAAEKNQQLEARAADLTEQAMIAKRRLSEDLLHAGFTNRLSDARFSDADLLALGEMLSAPVFTASELKDRRERAQARALPPTAEQQTILESCGTGATPAEVAPVPTWVKTMCQNRDAFANCAIGEDRLEVGGCCFLFLYATQKPPEAMFLKLHRIAKPRVAVETWEDVLDRKQPPGFRLDFTYTPSQYVSSGDLDFDHPSGLFILEEIYFAAQGLAGTDCELDDFAAFVSRRLWRRAPLEPLNSVCHVLRRCFSHVVSEVVWVPEGVWQGFRAPLAHLRRKRPELPPRAAATRPCLSSTRGCNRFLGRSVRAARPPPRAPRTMPRSPRRRCSPKR